MKRSKEEILETLENYASEEMMQYIDCMIQLGAMDARRDLKEFLYPGESGKIDFARPAPWVKEVSEMGVKQDWLVWSYLEHRISGAPLNLADEFMKHVIKTNTRST